MDTRIASTCHMKCFFACDVAERVLGITNDFRHMIFLRWFLFLLSVTPLMPHAAMCIVTDVILMTTFAGKDLFNKKKTIRVRINW